jgi:hypothetical protein
MLHLISFSRTYSLQQHDTWIYVPDASENFSLNIVIKFLPVYTTSHTMMGSENLKYL